MRIGYLTNDLFNVYNCTIWQGIHEACARRKAKATYYLGGVLRSPLANQYMRNSIFDLAQGGPMEGLIVNAATIFHYLEDAGRVEFLRKFGDIPVVTIGVRVEGYPAVLVDNGNGVREGVIHLAEMHSRKRIAFVTGPGFNAESRERCESYKRTLAECGLPVDPDLIRQGNFIIDSGVEALEGLFAGKRPPDAIVFANDDMAMGALQKAAELGIEVPGKLSLMGFDDIPDSRYSLVPLTTVRQPLYEEGVEAVNTLLDLMEGKKVQHVHVLPTRLVVRRSCGCFSRAIQNAAADARPSPEEAGAEREWAAELRSVFAEHMGLDGSADFLWKLEKLMFRDVAAGAFDPQEWQDAISRLSLPVPEKDAEHTAWRKAEDFINQSRILVQEMGLNVMGQAQAEEEQRSIRLRDANTDLVSSFDLKELFAVMAERLPEVGVSACYLALWDEDPGSGFSRLMFGYDGTRREALPPRGIRFPTKELIPAELRMRQPLDDFIAEALFFREEVFGFVLLKAKPQRIYFHVLQQQIASAMKGALLMQEVKDAEKTLAVLLDDQKHRSAELENAYTALKDNQAKLLLTEKMASLGRMTAGIAHEMNTPLAAIRTALSQLKGLMEELSASSHDPAVTGDDLKGIASDVRTFVSLSLSSAERLAGFIQSVKSQTAGLSSSAKTSFNAVPVIKDAILFLSYRLQTGKCRVEFKPGADRVDLFGSPARFSQVVTNLIANSIDAYKSKGGGVIMVTLEDDGAGAELAVEDQGCGIAREIMPKIFDPLFSTKTFAEGTGLGLTIVHDIITGEFGGTIDVESEQGKGTRFRLMLPRSADMISIATS